MCRMSIKILKIKSQAENLIADLVTKNLIKYQLTYLLEKKSKYFHCFYHMILFPSAKRS